MKQGDVSTTPSTRYAHSGFARHDELVIKLPGGDQFDH